VYFYPSAYTQGCNVQAHTFSVNQDGKFPVASDANGSIAKSYDLNIRQGAGLKDTKGNEVDHGLAERTTFVVAPDGKVAATIGDMTPTENVMKALLSADQRLPQWALCT
jgi:thioredoxin-dependent peroxiredoxin